MYFEIIALGALFLVVLNYTKVIDVKKCINDNVIYFRRFKESDYDFLVRAKYGEGVDPDYLFGKRISNGFIVAIVVMCLMINNFSYVNFIVAIVVGILVFKMDYQNLKSYYKNNLHTIDSMLPHYLKGLEILIQHYTVPVAIAKSVDSAPEIFKKGLIQLVAEINAGNSSIEPYMEFARTYPVRDSMRMMRLLYRLSLGRQERKQEQLLTFSRSISSLQQKARETKYKERLDKMEGKTMSMLISTGLGVMILLVLAVMQMMNT
mgnify:FL=1|jgi:hypothetical protein